MTLLSLLRRSFLLIMCYPKLSFILGILYAEVSTYTELFVRNLVYAT